MESSTLNSILQKRRLINYLLVLGFLILPFYISSNASYGNLSISQTVQQLPAPAFEPSEIDFGVYFGNNPAVPRSEFSTLLSLYDQNFGQNVNVTDLTQIGDSRVYVIISPEQNITRTQAESVRDEVLESGKGLFYIINGNNKNSTIAANKFFSEFFGKDIVNVSSTPVVTEGISSTLNYTTVTEFVSPSSPVFNNVTKLYFNGSSISINNSALNAFTNDTNQIAIIKDSYSLMKSQNKMYDLALAFEFMGLTETSNKGRVVILASTETLVDKTLSGTTGSIPVKGVQNGQFGINILKWLGKASGYTKLIKSYINLNNGTLIYPDFEIKSNFTLNDDIDRSFSDGIVKVVMESANNYVLTQYAEPLEKGHYSTSIKADLVPSKRSFEVKVIIERRGYLEQSFTLATHVYVSPFLSSWSLPNLMQTLTLISALVIYTTTAGFLWLKIRKVE